MFSKAFRISSEYTRPIIVTKRLENQEVTCGMATFVVVNDSGWVLTAAHVVQDLIIAEQHKKERDEYQSNIIAINANPSYSAGRKKHEINELKKNWEWITHHSLWWATDGIGFKSFNIDGVTDLAVGQLSGPIEKLNVKSYPVFAKPE